MMALDLQAYIRRTAAEVERALDLYTRPERFPGAPDALVEAMRYSLLGGGKRLRPLLALAAAELCGGEAAAAMPAACAVEMIHTYSLIHDDLPAMDDDDMRRGRPTNHKMFGEAIAILAGDALLTLAFQVLGESAENPEIGPARASLALTEIARAAGPLGMAGGQVMDLAAEGRNLAPGDLEAIHRMKTGALFGACLRAGAIVGGGGRQELAALTTYAHHFGLAFQIYDDVLDVAGDATKLGKPVGSDQRHDKATYVKLYSLAQAQQMALEQAEAAVAALAPFGERAAVLRALARYVVERDS